MFAAERIRIIKQILLENKRGDVASLSELLNVSEVTIRRDLEKLEKEHFLTRIHGGAILNEDEEEEDCSYHIQSDPFFNERMEIGEIASQMIENNDIILLSSGLTNLCTAKKIVNKRNLTVLTNDMNIASELAANPGIKVIIPGGDLDPNTMSLVGKLTEENIKTFFVTKAFIEVEGISMKRGYTVQSMEKASLIKEIFHITNERIIISHYKSFDAIAFSQIGALTMADKVITNPKIPDTYKKYFFENNIQLFTAFNTYKGGI
jgi:DeoR/GlpR family transcriptional regulator of sugar metabolism